jgi:formate dehydrogenase
MPPGPAEVVPTFCRICEQHCGVLVTVEANRAVRIAPDKLNPHTWRDFCIKGKSAAEAVEHPRRIVTPLRRVGDRYEPATYEEAIDEVASMLRRIIDESGPDAVASYYGNPLSFNSGGLVCFTALVDGIGTHNRYNWGSVDTNAFTVVTTAMYGVPMLPLVPDVDLCRCFLFVGMNPAESEMNWMGCVPNGWRRVLAACGRGADLIVVDPRRTPTAERATTHIAIRPGHDWAFLLGLVKVIFEERLEASEACGAADGLDELRALAAEPTLDELGRRAGVAASAIADVARRFATAPTAMAVARTGPSQTSRGTLALWLTEALNVITDRWDRPGGRRFERGYLGTADMLVRAFAGSEHRSRVTGRPMIGGCHALHDLPHEILEPRRGQVRALLLAGGNPVVSGPDGSLLDRALSELELLVAVDLVQRESHRHAHWLIPGTHWLEREELFPALASFDDEPFVQYAQRALDAPEGVRPEWEFFVDLALALDVPLFGPRLPNDAIRASRERAHASGDPEDAFSPRWIWKRVVNAGGRLDFDDIVARPHGWVYGEREYGHAASSLRTATGRVQLAPATIVAEARRQVRAPVSDDGEGLVMVNRRRRSSMNSWLNELPTSRQRVARNVVEVHPTDAARLGLVDGGRAEVRSAIASVELDVVVSDAPRVGTVVVEHGWGSRVFDPHGGGAPEVLGANRNLLTANDAEDPLSQMSAFNETRVTLHPA